MECYRKRCKWSKFLPTWTNLYRFSSGYGQRYIRAGLVLLILIFVLVNSHMYLGLRPTPNSSNKYHGISHSLIPNNLSLERYLYDLGATTVYCIEVLTRQEEQDRLFYPVSIYVEALNVTLSVILYVEVLFFVLALRRHFKR